jgi:hypothetical protein
MFHGNGLGLQKQDSIPQIPADIKWFEAINNYKPAAIYPKEQ